MAENGAGEGGQAKNAEGEAHEFKAPQSQAELDKIIENRLGRERAKYSDYDDLKAKAEQFQKIEDEKKSEIEKATERANQAQAEAEKFQRENARLSVIAKHQIPEEFQDLVQGMDGDSLAASAEKVQKLIAASNENEGSNDKGYRYVVPNEGKAPATLPLNGEGIEDALRKAIGA